MGNPLPLKYLNLPALGSGAALSLLVTQSLSCLARRQENGHYPALLTTIDTESNTVPFFGVVLHCCKGSAFISLVILVYALSMLATQLLL